MQSLTYSAILDVDISNFDTEEQVTEQRLTRALYVLTFYFMIPLISLISISLVKEDLKRLRYKLNATTGAEPTTSSEMA